MTSIMSQAWKIVKPHIPLIRFRKGGPASSANAAPAGAAGSPSVGAKSQQSGTVIEDHQLPLRYRRLPLDEKEIDAINSGGAY